MGSVEDVLEGMLMCTSASTWNVLCWGRGMKWHCMCYISCIQSKPAIPQRLQCQQQQLMTNFFCHWYVHNTEWLLVHVCGVNNDINLTPAGFSVHLSFSDQYIWSLTKYCRQEGWEIHYLLQISLLVDFCQKLLYCHWHHWSCWRIFAIQELWEK